MKDNGGYGNEALSEDRISGGTSCSTLSSPKLCGLLG
jgi:hypothetical protein